MQLGAADDCERGMNRYRLSLHEVIMVPHKCGLTGKYASRCNITKYSNEDFVIVL